MQSTLKRSSEKRKRTVPHNISTFKLKTLQKIKVQVQTQKASNQEDISIPKEKNMQQEPSMKAQLAHKMYLLNRFLEDNFMFPDSYKSAEKELFNSFKSMSEDERQKEIARTHEQILKLSM